MIKLFQIWILALVFIFACDTHEKVKDKNVISEKEKDETSNLSKVFRSEECDLDC